MPRPNHSTKVLYQFTIISVIFYFGNYMFINSILEWYERTYFIVFNQI